MLKCENISTSFKPDVDIDFHFHIPSLKAISGIAARGLLDPERQRTRQETSACSRARGRLPESLLRFIDKLYEELVYCAYCGISSSDALWLLPPCHRFLPLGGPSEPMDEFAAITSLYEHVRLSRTEIMHYLLCTLIETEQEHRADLTARREYSAAISRIYRSLISRCEANSVIVHDFTMTMLRWYPCRYIRQALRDNDPLFQARYDAFRSSECRNGRELYFAFADNDLESAFMISRDALIRNNSSYDCFRVLQLRE